MNLKKPISAAMAAVMTLSVTATPALAAAEDPPGTATQVDETEADATLGEQSSAEEDALNGSDTSEKSHQDAKVYASANGSYILTVPESINLHNVEKKDLGSGLYTNDKNCKVNLRGDVRQDQVVIVTVTEPVMQSEGSKDVDATVDTSSKTVWNREDMFTGATAGDDGSYTEPTGVTTVYPVSAELTPGDWVGTAMFNCSLETTSSIASVVTGIDPASFDYDGQEHTPGLIFADGSSLVEGKDYVISGDTAKVDEGDYTITVTGAGKYIGSASFDWKIKKYDITSDISATLDKIDFVADDTEHTPNIIWGGDSNLVEGTDYEISGTKSATEPGNYQITITGKGKYKGALTLDWTISATDIASIVDGLDQSNFEGDYSTVYTPNIVWKNGVSPVAGKDYDISGTTSSADGGDYTITIIGKGKYYGEITLDWHINAKPSISNYITGLSPVHFDYDGETHSPTLTFADGGSQLAVNTDYVIDGVQSSSEIGNFTITIKGIGEYGGTCTYKWSVGELIPANTTYTVSKTREQLVGDEVTVVFPAKANNYDTYVNDDYKYTCHYNSSSWSVAVKDKAKTSYDALRSYICDGPVTDLSETFKNCVNLKESPVIPGSVVSMRDAFLGCTSLFKAPIIPDNVTGLNGTFSGCTSLVEAPIVPGKVTDMGYNYDNKGTFEGCTSLKTYTGSTDSDGDFSNYVIPDSVTTMYSTFSDCAKLVEAPVIPDRVTNMVETFFGCASLTEAPIIGNSVTDMGYAFFGCTSLTEAPVIPDSVTDMSYTFSGCTSLTKAPVIPNNVTSMASTFSGCTSLKTYVGSTDSDGDFSNFIVPDNVTRMEGTFFECTSLVTAPVIPKNVTVMGYSYHGSDLGTFYGCTALTGTLVCNANPTECENALKDTDITYIGGTCSEETLDNFSWYDGNEGEYRKYTRQLSVALFITSDIFYEGGEINYETGIYEEYSPYISNRRYNDGYYCVFNEADYTVSKYDERGPGAPNYTMTITGIGNYAGQTITKDWTHTEYYTIAITGNEKYTDGKTGQVYTVADNVVIPDNIVLGSTLETDDYIYTCIVGSSETSYRDTYRAEWKVKAKENKASYEGLYTYIGDQTCCITDISDAFKDCTLMTEAPYIPGDIKYMDNAFSGCTSLTGTIKICYSDWADNFNPVSFVNALKGTQITDIECNRHIEDSTKLALLKTTGRSVFHKTTTSLASNVFKYDGNAHTPQLEYGGVLLEEGKDYTVSGDISKTECGNYTTTFTGIGNCFGTVTCEWWIAENPEVIPDGETYTLCDSGKHLVGNGVSVYFPLKAYKNDTYTDKDYEYTCFGNGWSVMVKDKSKVSYDSLRSNICDKPVTSLSGTFEGCYNLKVAPVIPDSVTGMYSTFENCTSLTEAPVIPDGVTDMAGTFYNCRSLLVAPEIPHGVTEVTSFRNIGNYIGRGNYIGTFFGCTSLKTYAGSTDPDGDFSNFIIPDSIKDISGVFCGCTSLVKAPVIPDGVTDMYQTFSGCTSLTVAAVIPVSVTDMGYAFNGCTSLTGTLICNANPTSYSNALRNTQITAIEGSCSEETKAALLATK